MVCAWHTAYGYPYLTPILVILFSFSIGTVEVVEVNISKDFFEFEMIPAMVARLSYCQILGR